MVIWITSQKLQSIEMISESGSVKEGLSDRLSPLRIKQKKYIQITQFFPTAEGWNFACWEMWVDNRGNLRLNKKQVLTKQMTQT